MCPSAPRVCSEPGGQKPVLSLSLDLILHTKYIVYNVSSSMKHLYGWFPIYLSRNHSKWPMVSSKKYRGILNVQLLEPWINIKVSYRYRKSHHWDKTILRPSYLYNGISCSSNTTSLYRTKALGITADLACCSCPGLTSRTVIGCYASRIILAQNVILCLLFAVMKAEQETHHVVNDVSPAVDVPNCRRDQTIVRHHTVTS